MATAASGGIPGALSNKPPADATVGEGLAPDAVAAGDSRKDSNIQRRATRNYELDKTISHTRMPLGSLRRLSTAVLLDYKRSLNEQGEVIHTEHSPEELLQITALVKEAIGYNAVRGDSVSVMNAEFTRPDPMEPLPESPVWQQSWVLDLAKQVVGGLFVLFLVFGVLKPILKNLVNKEISFNQAVLAGAPSAGALPAGGAAGSQAQMNQGNDVPQLNSPSSYQNSLQSVQGMVKEDPQLTAQVVKSWVGEDS